LNSGKDFDIALFSAEAAVSKEFVP